MCGLKEALTKLDEHRSRHEKMHSVFAKMNILTGEKMFPFYSYLNALTAISDEKIGKLDVYMESLRLAHIGKYHLESLIYISAHKLHHEESQEGKHNDFALNLLEKFKLRL